MEDVRLERAPFFPFCDPIIPLVLLLEIACWIGPDRKNIKASFHSGKLSVDWNGQQNFSLSCEVWVGTNDFNTKKNVLVCSNPRIIFLSGN
jgi:hypothetical protein